MEIYGQCGLVAAVASCLDNDGDDDQVRDRLVPVLHHVTTEMWVVRPRQSMSVTLFCDVQEIINFCEQLRNQ
jgi:hypothetical protein